MPEPTDEQKVIAERREQMLKLVTKGFYNELVNYGVRDNEIIQVASHLLDNLMAQGDKPKTGIQYYNNVFTLSEIRDEWADRRELGVHQVVIRPLQPAMLGKLGGWLGDPSVRETFVPPFPQGEAALRKYFKDPTRDYFGIFHDDVPVGIIGGENLDTAGGKLEMKKLVGEPGLHGKGVGKRATFAFLHYAFNILNLNKVYIHSRDINIRNISLNSRFGFEVEGIFFEDAASGGKRQDIVRMALFKSLWLRIFSAA